MGDAFASKEAMIIIRPKSGWQLINFRELREYRDLFYFLVWRDVKILYAQTILGLSWAVLQPAIQIVIFSIVFGKVANLSSEGMPYLLFATAAIIPWTYMSQAMTQSSDSLVSHAHMLNKIYFPRLIYPITPILARLVDFGVSMVIIFGVAIYYRVLPSWNLLFFPLFLLLMMAVAAGIGMWLSAMAIRFRDVRHAMPFAVRMLMYTAPIVYSASSIPENFRIIYSLNPLVGVIEGFRACLLGTPFQWQYICPGILVGGFLLISGAFYFKRMERIFADVI